MNPLEVIEMLNGKSTTMKIIDLPLRSMWYNMIESGEKREEYRNISPYWCQRLIEEHHPRIYWERIRYYKELTASKRGATFVDWLRSYYKMTDYTHVRFRYGYTKRTMLFELKEIVIGIGNPLWGAPDYEVFILRLGERCDT